MSKAKKLTLEEKQAKIAKVISKAGKKGMTFKEINAETGISADDMKEAVVALVKSGSAKADGKVLVFVEKKDDKKSDKKSDKKGSSKKKESSDSTSSDDSGSDTADTVETASDSTGSDTDTSSDDAGDDADSSTSSGSSSDSDSDTDTSSGDDADSSTSSGSSSDSDSDTDDTEEDKKAKKGDKIKRSTAKADAAKGKKVKTHKESGKEDKKKGHKDKKGKKEKDDKPFSIPFKAINNLTDKELTYRIASCLELCKTLYDDGHKVPAEMLYRSVVKAQSQLKKRD